MGGRVLADVLDDERVAVLERVDRHVLGAVVLEHALDVLGLGDQQQVADEDRDPDQALDEVLDEPVLDVGVVALAMNSGSRKKIPTPTAG